MTEKQNKEFNYCKFLVSILATLMMAGFVLGCVVVYKSNIDMEVAPEGKIEVKKNEAQSPDSTPSRVNLKLKTPQ